jgi:two-component system, chemotaxis family, chemotaxis protein CheY
LAETLAIHGFEVVTASDGFEALGRIRDEAISPSVVLLDLMMPVMDGYAFLEARRRDPALAAIPVAIITAAHRVDRSRIGNAPIIWKPIDLPHLIEVLTSLGAERRSQP